MKGARGPIWRMIIDVIASCPAQYDEEPRQYAFIPEISREICSALAIRLRGTVAHAIELICRTVLPCDEK